jgi:single-strand DNA-binding protein
MRVWAGIVVGEVMRMTNEIQLEGRLSRPPEERVLPSGDTIWTFRVVVAREPGSRPGVDWFDCTVRNGRLRRSVSTWGEGDVVRVGGALRRRFFRVGGQAESRVEVEAAAGRLIRRAGPA